MRAVLAAVPTSLLGKDGLLRARWYESKRVQCYTLLATWLCAFAILGPLGLWLGGCWTKDTGVGFPDCIEDYSAVQYVPIMVIVILGVPLIGYFVFLLRGGAKTPNSQLLHRCIDDG